MWGLILLGSAGKRLPPTNYERRLTTNHERRIPMDIVNLQKGTKIRFTPDKESGVQLIPWTIADSPEPVHWHHSLEICCCVSGKGAFYFTERQYEISAGDIIIVN